MDEVMHGSGSLIAGAKPRIFDKRFVTDSDGGVLHLELLPFWALFSHNAL
jgi:hypothetical protein